MDKNKTKITVVGGGNGGFAAAGDLKNRGFNVKLCELPQFSDNIKDIKELGGINFKALPTTGLKGGFAKLDKITTNFEEGLKDSEVIFVIVPAFAQSTIAKACAPYLEDDQIIVLTPGNFCGSVDFYNEIRKASCDKNVKIAETESMMYACRKKNSTTIWARGYKHNLGIASFPAIDIDYVYEKIIQIYPTFVKRSNILETGLSNANAILHVPIMLLNLSNIDNNAEILFYHQALTHSIGKVISKLDEERLSINKIKGINLKPMKDIAKEFYSYQGAKGNTMFEIHRTNPIYKWSKLPTTLNHRYLTEDVPYGLIPLYKFAKKYNCAFTTMKAIADLCCLVTGIDFYKNSRDLESLNLGSYNEDQIIEFVTNGKLS